MMTTKASTGLHPQPHTYNALLLGYYATGKTSILSNFSRHPFQSDYVMTINPSQATRLFNLDSQFSVRLKLMDSLGSLLGKQAVSNRLSECDAIFLVYDMTKQNEQSFYRLDKWMGELQDQKELKKAVTILVGTHCDQPYKRKISSEEALKWQKKNRVDFFFEVSCKTNENFNNMFQQVAKALLPLHNKPAMSWTEPNPELETPSAKLPDNKYERSRVQLLEKKLSFKEMECQRLWSEYEEALQRISDLEEGCPEKSDSSHLLSSYKECETDADELQCKLRTLQENLRVLEQFYTERQAALEQSTCKRLQGLNHHIDELQTEKESLLEVTRLREKAIEELSANRDQFRAKVGELEFDLQEEKKEYNRLANEVNFLQGEVKERTCLLEGEDCPSNATVLSNPSLRFLHSKFLHLVVCLQEKEDQLLRKNYQIKQLLSQHQKLQAQFQQERAVRQGQSYSLSILVQHLSQQVLLLKAQSLLRERLQEELKETLMEKEKQFDAKSDEYLQIIEHKEESIRVLVQNSQAVKEELELVNRQYQKLYKEFAENNRVLQNKETILEKIIGEKIAEIQDLKAFIEEIGTHSKHIVKKYSNSKDLGNKDKVLSFVTHFFERLDSETTDICTQFQAIFTSTKEIGLKLSGLLNNVSSLQINQSFMDCAEQLALEKKREHLQLVKNHCQTLTPDQLKETLSDIIGEYQQTIADVGRWQFTLWQTLHGNSKEKVEHLQLNLTAVLASTQEVNQAFQERLEEMQANLTLLQQITEVGLQDYANSYYN